MMFGYASNETDSFLPATIHYAHELAKQLSKVRKNSILPFLLAD
jgi:S-adenosylmethionine synthetase